MTLALTFTSFLVSTFVVCTFSHFFDDEFLVWMFKGAKMTLR
jgi:hypothetical protein